MLAKVSTSRLSQAWYISISLFFLVWAIDSVVIPVLLVLELGLDVLSKSAFYVRFGSLSAFGISLIPILFARSPYIKTKLFTYVFFFVLAIGSILGLFWSKSISTGPFLSHLYYYIMPITCFGLGWNGYIATSSSKIYAKKLKLTMDVMYWSGLLSSLFFIVLKLIGIVSYPAMGMWNLVVTSPYYLFNGSSLLFVFGLVASVLTGKRTTLLVVIAFSILLLFLSKSLFKKMYIIVFLIVAALLFSQTPASFSDRIMLSIADASSGDLDGATANRWAETLVAFSITSQSLTTILFGNGFGAEFYPWGNLPGYLDYKSHYTHFVPMSYAWSGGIIAVIAVYSLLFKLLASSYNLTRLNLIPLSDSYVAFWILSILVSSFSGASLMNNSFLWFMIGFSASCVQKYR